MKIGIAQINTIVGDLPGNRERLIAAYKDLVHQGAELVIAPEMVVTGYPPRDLLWKRRFVPDNLESIRLVAAEVGSVPLVAGYVSTNETGHGKPFFNSAAWCELGRVVHSANKCLLPTYDVFDEDRYFESGRWPNIFTWKGKRIGITICEDIWTAPFVPTRQRYRTDPVAALAAEGVDLVINLSASPWHMGKTESRKELIAYAARTCAAPVVYVNAVGGNDELVFDGRSLVVNARGERIAGLSGFREECRVVDLDAAKVQDSPTFDQEEMADIHDALVLGLRDYAQKTNFRKALVGLSGGVDSALVAELAVEALGAANVIGVSLPSDISSQHSKDDAAALARNLGIRYETVSIADIVRASEGSLAALFNGHKPDVTEENIQARARGLVLMALSNKFGALLLTTGNKSELSVGYCTLYGDMCGGLAVISDLPKVKVFELCRWLNRDREVIPANTITKPPSAELRPGQKDEDSLPPYPVLDAILRLYVEEGASSASIVEAGFDPAVVADVVRKVDLNEYKRKQAAPGIKLTPLAFGIGRRIPIVQRYRQ